jgi:EmrB/QacA subfamily drug resistance transporter
VENDSVPDDQGVLMVSGRIPANSSGAISTEAAAPDPRRWTALAVLCAATFIIILDGSIVFVAVPSMAQDLKLTPSSLQWVLNSYLLAFGGLLLLGGRVADLLGRRRLFIFGGALLGASSLLCGLASSAEVLVTARVLEGLAAAIMTPAALSIITTTFSEGKERNKALGFWSTAGGVGGTTGALLGGPITVHLGWSWIFFINVPVAVLMVILSPLVLRESYSRSQKRTFDVAGAVVSTGAMVLLVYAVVNAPTNGWGSGRTLGFLAASAGAFVLFAIVEKLSSAPLAPLHLFRSKYLVGGNLVLLIVGMAVNGGMGFTLTQYAQGILGYSPVQFGMMFAVMTVLTILGSMLAGGPLVNRYGPRPVAVGALILIGISSLTLTQLSVDGSFAKDMLLGMVLFGPGLGAGFVAGSIASLTGVKEQDAGLASGLNSASFHVGGAIGIAIMAGVAITQGKGANPAIAAVDGFGKAFIASAIFAAVGLLAALTLLGRPRQQPVSITTATSSRTDRAA